MRKIVFFISLFAMTVFMACSSDDEGSTPAASGALSVDGESFDVSNGYVIDFGGDQSHYNLDFEVTDGSIERSFTDFDISGSLYFYVELFSPGTDKFSPGTFEFKSYSEDIEDDDFYFSSTELLIDANGDNKLDEEDDYYEVNAGTVTVSGNANNYTLDFDVTFLGGKTMTGKVSGKFQTVN